MALSACGSDEEVPLPATFEIVEGSNIYAATATLCGSTELDEQGRGRYRRWDKSDERIANAPRRYNPATHSTDVIIPPGTYKVPPDLCASEAADMIWWQKALVVLLVMLCVAGGALVGLYVSRRRTRPMLVQGMP